MKPSEVYLRAVFADWVGRMSGGGGLLLTIFGFFSPPGWQFRSFLFVGVLALIYASYRAWLRAFRTAEELSAKLQPRLEFFRQNDIKPFYEEVKGATSIQKHRYLRVGVRNQGGTEVPKARVLLEGFTPGTLPGLHLQHELQPMGKPPGTLEFAVAAFGTAIVDVAVETVGEAPYGNFSICYAQPLGSSLPYNDEPFELVLKAEGGGRPIRCSMRMGGRLAWRLDELQPLP